MARQTKTTKTADAVESAPVVNTVVSVEASASVPAKVSKKPVKKADVSASVVPVVSPSVVPVVETAPETVESDVADLTAQSSEFISKLNQMSSMVATLKSEYRNLEKKWSRELKAAQKTSSKKKRKTGNRAPSGFVKPARISNELATFLGKEKGTEMARTDVTREINKYIRSHNLQDKDNGRKINPDAKLKSLLKLNDTDELTYFNLQRYMSPHFTKTDKTVPSTTV
jgi:upstream activation factor subunit UAF30